MAKCLARIRVIVVCPENLEAGSNESGSETAHPAEQTASCQRADPCCAGRSLFVHYGRARVAIPLHAVSFGHYYTEVRA